MLRISVGSRVENSKSINRISLSIDYRLKLDSSILLQNSKIPHDLSTIYFTLTANLIQTIQNVSFEYAC